MALHRIAEGAFDARRYRVHGRAAILQLLPFSLEESPRVTMLAGGFPEALTLAKTRDLWFSSYVQTYLERDIRLITNVRDLATFRRFLALVASRHGQLLNKTDLAAPLGFHTDRRRVA